MTHAHAVNAKALILTPGASANRDDRTLVMLEAALPEIIVCRLTLATTSVKSAVNKIIAASEQLALENDIDPTEIVYGGRSFGGRACSVAAAEGLPAAGLLLLSYPLHPPGKPDKLRVDHFKDIDVPTLFVSGAKDPFGTEAEFKKHIKKIAGAVTFKSVPGNHSPKGQDAAIVEYSRNYLNL